MRPARATATCALAAALALPAATARAAGREVDLEALREAVEAGREKVAAYERDERGLLEAIEALDRAAGLIARDVALARQRSEAAGAELVAIEDEAASLSGQLARTRHALARRAVALYKAGEAGAVRLLFSAGGIRDFLARVVALRRLLGRDADLLARYRAQSAALARAEAAARAAAAEHGRAEAELRLRSRELAEQRAAKRALARGVRASRSRERAALAEVETAARALEQAVAHLGPAAPAPVGSSRFGRLRGRLPRPVEGRVARGFGRVVDPEFRTETFRKGVEFAAPAGSPVRAVATGRVRFAGWFRGYGRVAILDHGDDYFTVSGHLDGFEVEAGDAVRAGQVIARVGETGSLDGPKLYFEIRRGSEPLDPSDWWASSRPR